MVGIGKVALDDVVTLYDVVLPRGLMNSIDPGELAEAIGYAIQQVNSHLGDQGFTNGSTL